MAVERHHSALIVASLITVAAFIGATAYTQNRLARLDTLSSAIETNAVPSVDYLSRAALRLTRLNQLMDEAAAPGPQRASALVSARQEVTELQVDVRRYLRLPPLAGERAFWTELRANVDRAIRLSHTALQEEEEARGAPVPVDNTKVDDALDGAVRAVVATLDFDIRQSEHMARDVRDVRSATLRTVVELDAGATVVALVAVLIAYRASDRHDQLLRAHTALLAGRATELDRFAGRVAHDILSPLGAIAAGLSLLARNCDAHGKIYVERSQQALRHVRQLVEDLLAFARSGAQPDPASRCDARSVVASVVADCGDTAAEKGVEVVIDAEASIAVACSPGVLTSIVQNLVRNAIKYMGARPLRRIDVRASRVGRMTRLEVKDTGPGIPPDLLGTIFEPFVRGQHDGVSGSGLGLATVKRLAESHGGLVRVDSTPGVGSLFTVELPLASPPAVVHEPRADVRGAERPIL